MTTLPQLEHLLVAAARRRAGRRTGLVRGRRGSLVLVGAMLTAGGATAATQLLKVDEGSHARGRFVIERLPDRDGRVCLQYNDDTGRRATYGCGSRPSDERPIGLVVVDQNALPGKRIVYGLVAAGVARVSVLGRGEEHVDAAPRAQEGVPGRYFLTTVPKTPGIELVAYDVSGQEIGRLGSREKHAHPPRSHDEAIAQGNPIGFAPTAAPVPHFSYRGQPINPDDAARRQLICVEDEYSVRCYDSEGEMETGEKRAAGRHGADTAE